MAEKTEQFILLNITIDGRDPNAADVEGCGLPTLVYLAREKRPSITIASKPFMCMAEKVRSCISSLIYLACGLDLLLQGMGDLFGLAFSWMRASLLKLDLAFLRPLISFVGRSGFAVENESGAVDFRLGRCVANRTALLQFADPFEHGEVFVLDDGGEVDLDLGNYKRFLDVTLTRDNNITTGKIYQSAG
ncbi:unnamed protein product [Prunus armeniaca]